MSDEMSDQPERPARTMGHPDCEHPEEDCRVVWKGHSTTQIAWEPVYDGNGRMVNEDPNTFTTDYACTCCNRLWTVTRKGQHTELVNR